ncbi:isopentenyltransferase 1 [Tripterygium wilfordii]|uniref:Isopentenyltransferase 1 n=1 Tax=Tripterygium wilfordii TaxID=458696 RepID=A0A7J7CXD8_TRIWF|nr:isopentenyltransferase 1 [Tripterygium wilfordii]
MSEIGLERTLHNHHLKEIRGYLVADAAAGDLLSVIKYLLHIDSFFGQDDHHKMPQFQFFKLDLEQKVWVLMASLGDRALFLATDFRSHASLAVESILGRGRLPIIAGGSNSYIEALVNEDPEFRLRYECCFLWVDVSLPVLNSFVSERVDKMVKAGLVDEVRKMFKPNADYSQGIRRAIGVPEMDEYLRNETIVDQEARARLLGAAIENIKDNTCSLAYKQLQKIHRLHNQWRWKMHRIDATDVFLKRGEEAEEAWDKLVVRPSTMIVEKLLDDEYMRNTVAAITAVSAAKSVPVAAVAAASL